MNVHNVAMIALGYLECLIVFRLLAKPRLRHGYQPKDNGRPRGPPPTGGSSVMRPKRGLVIRLDTN